jgi:hypothetical protein
MLDKLKANWFNILLALVGLLSSADAAVGIRGGKSPMNITVIPSILAALGAGGTLGVKWLNGRTVVTRTVKQGLSPDLLERLENLYGLARDPDVTPDHASHLAGMAGDLLLAEHRRAKLEQAKTNQPVVVTEPLSFPGEFAALTAKLREMKDVLESKDSNKVNTNQETAR